VAKIMANDSVIPDNVTEAVNFYQTQGIIHGRRRITRRPARTEILGNYRMDYKKSPIEPGTSWWDRVFTPATSRASAISISGRNRNPGAAVPHLPLPLPPFLQPTKRGQAHKNYSKILSINRVVPTNAATAATVPLLTFSTGSRLSASTISK